MAYLLPQALLELKTRLSSRANLHIVLDSRLHSRAYRDETFAMLNEMASMQEILLAIRKLLTKSKQRSKPSSRY